MSHQFSNPAQSSREILSLPSLPGEWWCPYFVLFIRFWLTVTVSLRTLDQS